MKSKIKFELLLFIFGHVKTKKKAFKILKFNSGTEVNQLFEDNKKIGNYKMLPPKKSFPICLDCRDRYTGYSLNIKFLYFYKVYILVEIN